MNLTDLDTVKTLIGDAQLGVSFDDELNLRIAAVSKRAELACSRSFGQATHTEIHHGGESRIYVDNPPIVSITSIVWDDFGDFDNGYVFPSIDYIVVNRSWDIAYTNGPFPGGDNSLRVIYVGGYASGSIPADLSLAIAQQVVWEHRARKNFGLTDVSFPDGSIAKSSERSFLPFVRDILKTYRTPRIG